MHSSRMRTVCSSTTAWGVSASVHAGIHTPPAWAWTPLGLGLETPPQPDPPTSPWVCSWRPPGQSPQPPPGYGPGDPPQPDPPTSPLGMGLETPPSL